MRIAAASVSVGNLQIIPYGSRVTFRVKKSCHPASVHSSIVIFVGACDGDLSLMDGLVGWEHGVSGIVECWKDIKG